MEASRAIAANCSWTFAAANSSSLRRIFSSSVEGLAPLTAKPTNWHAALSRMAAAKACVKAVLVSAVRAVASKDITWSTKREPSSASSTRDFTKASQAPIGSGTASACSTPTRRARNSTPTIMTWPLASHALHAILRTNVLCKCSTRPSSERVPAPPSAQLNLCTKSAGSGKNKMGPVTILRVAPTTPRSARCAPPSAAASASSRWTTRCDEPSGSEIACSTVTSK
mmetsp:Transcript_60406/g.168793  ORF Transcript_60406/g.168793 Transcript_60406/m.168793 type:complete len:226 (+) Transcript_60406:374-1051(+)